MKEESKLKIVIADGYTLNPGDLDWKGIGRYGEITYYDRTPAAEMAGRCRPTPRKVRVASAAISTPIVMVV